jgi:signal transduction histidine kinase
MLGDDPEDRRKSLEIVMDELERMTRFVNDLLVLARADHPDFLALDTVDVAVLSEEMLTKARSLGSRRWVVDEVGRGVIVADRQRLTQAVMQLAQNACEHTADEAEIALGSSVRGGEARFWVRDTGPGIAPADRDHVFDRFRRGRVRRSSEGVGLGLSIVKAIADAHHGAVELETAPGAGATFVVRVPVDQPLPTEETSS